MYRRRKANNMSEVDIVVNHLMALNHKVSVMLADSIKRTGKIFNPDTIKIIQQIMTKENSAKTLALLFEPLIISRARQIINTISDLPLVIAIMVLQEALMEIYAMSKVDATNMIIDAVCSEARRRAERDKNAMSALGSIGDICLSYLLKEGK